MKRAMSNKRYGCHGQEDIHVEIPTCPTAKLFKWKFQCNVDYSTHSTGVTEFVEFLYFTWRKVSEFMWRKQE